MFEELAIVVTVYLNRGYVGRHSFCREVIWAPKLQGILAIASLA
jgi:hypothetical protein